MNFRYVLGATVSHFLHASLSARWFPLTRVVPVGLSWTYDLQRFAGTRNPRVLVDAGANVGQTSRHLARYCPASAIHAFEPVQATYRTLREKTRHLRNVRCVPCALGATAGRATITLRENPEMNSLIQPPASPPAEGSTQETIELTTLDSYCQKEGIDSVDVLKLDVQGYELEVLKGSVRLLAGHRIKFVYAEVSFSPENREMQDFSQLNLFLTGQGFCLSGFYEPFRWGEKREFLGFCNALFVCPEALRSS